MTALMWVAGGVGMIALAAALWMIWAGMQTAGKDCDEGGHH